MKSIVFFGKVATIDCIPDQCDSTKLSIRVVLNVFAVKKGTLESNDKVKQINHTLMKFIIAETNRCAWNCVVNLYVGDEVAIAVSEDREVTIGNISHKVSIIDVNDYIKNNL